ncbi:MAG TPA: hypothetical protein VJB05_01525 [archaeon]|nr:hypothetical protein [archaeon]
MTITDTANSDHTSWTGVNEKAISDIIAAIIIAPSKIMSKT